MPLDPLHWRAIRVMDLNQDQMEAYDGCCMITSL
jgi:hypothetical protein